ncbi:MAG: peptide ABC transporter substrate-binding protein [Gemmatimonadaceae bacterium]|nr:peptide ABC transporter substrate-binding protein [Gemmatimonadaceae bacterium]
MRSLLRLLPVVAILASTACRDSSTTAGDSANADATAGGTLVLASAGDADNLLPGMSTAITSQQVVDLVFDRLAEIGGDLSVVGDAGFKPQLARRWTWAADSLSIAFELDPRARWHDGRPVRASDVRFSYSLYRDPSLASQVAPNIASIDSVTVRDSLTVVAWYAKRSPQQFFDAVHHALIVPEHVYGTGPLSQLRGSDRSRNPVGSGRFRFVRWDAGSRIELVSDTANYRGRALLDRVIWTLAADPAGALARIVAGEADFFEAVPADRAPAIDSLPSIRVFAYPGSGYAFMGMNSRDGRGSSAPHRVFGDVRVRRALTMATNRPALLENVFGGYGLPAYGPFPASMAISDTTIPQLPFDTLAARALLDSAGWQVGAGGIRQKDGRPLRFSLLAPQSSAPRMAYAVLLQAQFRRVGADVRLETVDFPTSVTRSRDRDYDAALQAWGTGPGPGAFRGRWGSETAMTGDNLEGYRNPAMDVLVDSALASYDPERTKSLMRRAYELIIADAPAIWLYDLVPVAAAHERLRIPAFRADKWWVHLADWYIPEGERIERDRIGLRAAPVP